MKKFTLFFVAILLVITMFGACGAPAPQAQESPTPAVTPDATPDTPEEEDVEWPTRPIMLTVGFGAGGSSDMMARILADYMSRDLGVPVQVVNNTGGGGFVAWSEFLRTADTDGYDFAMINTPNIVVGLYDEANPRDFDHTAFDLLANHVTDWNVIAMRPDETRFTDMLSLVEYARENELLFGTSSVGIMSDDDTIAQRLNVLLGTQFVPVVTSGAAENTLMLLNGSADLIIANVGDVLIGHGNGDYVTLVVFAAERNEFLPEVPTAYELGLGMITGHSSRGYAFPPGVNPNVRALMMAALERAIYSDEVVEAMAVMGLESNFLTGDAFFALLEAVRDEAFEAYGLEG